MSMCCRHCQLLTHAVRPGGSCKSGFRFAGPPCWRLVAVHRLTELKVGQRMSVMSTDRMPGSRKDGR